MSSPLLLKRAPSPEFDDATLMTLDRLTSELSSTLLHHIEGLPGSVEHTLHELVDLLGAGRCSLIRPARESNAVDVAYSCARAGVPLADAAMLSALPWYVRGLPQGEPIVMNRLPDDFPFEARGVHVPGIEGAKSWLVLPVVVDGYLVCALDVATFREYRTWTLPVVQRLRLMVEIVAAALCRQQPATHHAHRDHHAGDGAIGAETRYLREEIDHLYGFHEIVGVSPALRTCLAQVSEVAPTDATVLLTGETGTGKDLFARAVHERSARSRRAFVAVNCAALPAALIESELFGHERGSFTGAVSLRQGRFETADHGTLFLDEIGDLPMELQAKLLRVLQEGEFERVGSSHKRKVDVRVIAATNHDLTAMVADGRFRSDLFYRLNVFPICLPPLRERTVDIPPLVWHIIHRRQKMLHRTITRVPDDVMERLQSCEWLGNVRELQNVVERAMIHSPGDTLVFDGGTRESGPATHGTLDHVQRQHIVQTLEACGWRINGGGNAAEQLGLHPNTLRFRMTKLGISRPPHAGA